MTEQHVVACAKISQRGAHKPPINESDPHRALANKSRNRRDV